MNRFMKTALAAFLLSLFLLAAGNPPATAPTPVAADTVFGDHLWEGTTYMYEITQFKTASGATEAPVALGGGPMIYDNSTPGSLGGHFTPVGRVATPSWSNVGDWRNVLMLGEGYTFEVMVDTVSPEEEETFPADEPITPLISTYNEYGVGAINNYLPTNPYSQTTVFLVSQLATLVWDDDGDQVTVPATDPTTGEAGDYPSFLDFKLTEPWILPLTQYVDGNDTFYAEGDAVGAISSWIPVGVYPNVNPDVGWWTLEYRAATAAATPLNVAPFYEVASVGHDMTTGICYSFEIVNQQMLAWISDPADPLVSFKVMYTGYELPEILQPEETSKDEDGPGFELGVVLFSLASVAAIVAYRKKN
ncbi:MAG: hypothetical protein ACE5OZ_03285 [Candidatus Heimdallarchaeota archaeon]